MLPDQINHIDVVSIRAFGLYPRDVLPMAQAPLDKNDTTKFVGFKLIGSMADSVDELAAEMSVSRSVLIREALSEYLAAHQEVAA